MTFVLTGGVGINFFTLASHSNIKKFKKTLYFVYFISEAALDLSVPYSSHHHLDQTRSASKLGYWLTLVSFSFNLFSLMYSQCSWWDPLKPQIWSVDFPTKIKQLMCFFILPVTKSKHCSSVSNPCLSHAPHLLSLIFSYSIFFLHWKLQFPKCPIHCFLIQKICKTFFVNSASFLHLASTLQVWLTDTCSSYIYSANIHKLSTSRTLEALWGMTKKSPLLHEAYVLVIKRLIK